MTTSPDGARLLNNQWGILFDAEGNNWRVVDGNIYENGVYTGYGSAQELDYINGQIWEGFSSGLWRVWYKNAFDGPDAGFPNSPRGAPYPPGFNEYSPAPGASSNWWDSRNWSQFAPDNYRNTYSEIKTGTVFLGQSQWIDGNNLWLNGGSLWTAPGDAFGAYFTIEASMISPDEYANHNYVNTIEVPEGTVQSWALIGVNGPNGFLSGSEQLKLEMPHGTFVNNGHMFASGAQGIRNEFDITARSQYPGWSGNFYNNALITLSGGKMVIDAPMHGNGTVSIALQSKLQMLSPDDAGVFDLSGSSVLEFGAPKSAMQFLGNTVPATRPAVQFGGTINFWDDTSSIQLDDVIGSSLRVTHPNGAITRLDVLDNTNGVLASLNLGNTPGHALSAGAFSMQAQGPGTTIYVHPHAG